MERIADWGDLTGPLVVYGGVYSNLQAFEALVTASGDVPPGNTICTGDIVAYCADAATSVAAVRRSGHRVIAGNCETQLAANALDCGCGFEEGSTCDRLSAAWYAHANAEIGAGDRAWMMDLPDWAVFTHAGRRVLALHAAPSANNRFVWPVTEDEDLRREVGIAVAAVGSVDLVLSGHSGIPFDRDLGGTRWVNAGVIGMPPHDGRAQTRYVRIEADGVVTLERLAYDPAATVRAMERAGLTQGYHRTLTSGIWPSEDVLPDALRR
ncbi:MAG: metallophosphoesterase family protein [Pseudomonadota bacterium]